jgi:DNA-binding NarL/FixJ family response regulator
MFNLSLVPYQPNAQGMQILHLLAKGFKQIEIARLLKTSAANMRWRITQLKINLGVKTIAQLMFEFGKYHHKRELKQNKIN